MTVRRWLYDRVPESMRPLVTAFYHTVHPGRSTERIRRYYRRDPIAEVAERIELDSPVVVDGGAHTGGSIEEFRRGFRSPRIHAFEPVPEHASTLEDEYGSADDVTVYPEAIGADDAEVTLFVNGSTATSSVRPLVREYRLRDLSVDEDAYEVRETITVQQRRLDSALPSRIDVLKLDVQGHELEALRGCDDLLEGCRAIIAEVAFLPYYRDQPLFSDIDLFLRDRGFSLFNLYHSMIEVDGRLGIADAVYFDRGRFAHSGDGDHR